MAAPNAPARRAFRAQVAQVQSQPATVTPSQAYELAAAPQASPDPMGRLRRSAAMPAPLYGAARAGNAAVISDQRGQPAAQPGKGAGTGIADTSPYPQRLIVTPASQLNKSARTPVSQHGRLIARDRRIAGSQGMVMFSGRNQQPGNPNPDADGPPRASWQQVNRTISHQIGTDATAFLDNTAAKPQTSAGSRPFGLGTRGDPQTLVRGGTPGLAAFRPYGYRGFPAGTAAPAPRQVALPGGPYKAGTLLAAGDPHDGPQKFYSGPPWGLHSQTLPPPKLTNAVQASRFGQVRPPMLNRPLNSAAQGQSYDQQVVHLNGRVFAVVPRMRPGRQPGLSTWRFR